MAHIISIHQHLSIFSACFSNKSRKDTSFVTVMTLIEQQKVTF